jgi:hypothetical protein
MGGTLQFSKAVLPAFEINAAAKNGLSQVLFMEGFHHYQSTLSSRKECASGSWTHLVHGASGAIKPCCILIPRAGRRSASWKCFYWGKSSAESSSGSWYSTKKTKSWGSCWS